MILIIQLFGQIHFLNGYRSYVVLRPLKVLCQLKGVNLNFLDVQKYPCIFLNLEPNTLYANLKMSIGKQSSLKNNTDVSQ